MHREFKINNFDLLRLFAACEVLFVHSFDRLQIPYPPFIKIMLNFSGVPMFFVMSGFLISASLERNPNIKNYFRNRALRIYPALWTCLILTIPVISIVAHMSFLNLQTIPWIICQFFGIIYTPAFLKNFGFGSYNGSLWTIPLELQFYIILPIIYLFASKLSKKENQKTFIIVATFLFFFILTYYLKAKFGEGASPVETFKLKVLRYTFIPNIYLFLLGVVMQRFKVYRSNLIFGKGLFWLIAFLMFCYWVPSTNTTGMFRFLFLGITTISLAYTLPATASKILKGNDVSYGVYIYHGLVLGVIVQLKLFGNANYAIVVILIAVVLAMLSWNFVEKPCIKRKKKTIHKLT